MGDELQDGGKIISRRILFYAGFAGEARSADYNTMPRSAQVKAHTARRTAHSYSTNIAESSPPQMRCLTSHV